MKITIKNPEKYTPLLVPVGRHVLPRHAGRMVLSVNVDREFTPEQIHLTSRSFVKIQPESVLLNGLEILKKDQQGCPVEVDRSLSFQTICELVPVVAPIGSELLLSFSYDGDQEVDLSALIKGKTKAIPIITVDSGEPLHLRAGASFPFHLHFEEDTIIRKLYLHGSNDQDDLKVSTARISENYVFVKKTMNRTFDLDTFIGAKIPAGTDLELLVINLSPDDACVSILIIGARPEK